MAGSKDTPQRVMRIFLWGFMGAGKSTLGKILAKQLRMPYIDLDQYITESRQKSIPDIFRECGEKGFRDMESAALAHLIEANPAMVLSCGGGTPCFGENAQHMNQTGITVFIDPSAARIIRRLITNPGDRPLITGKTAQEIAEYVHLNLLKRRSCYLKAQVHLPSALYPTKKDMLAALIQLGQQQ